MYFDQLVKLAVTVVLNRRNTPNGTTATHYTATFALTDEHDLRTETKLNFYSLTSLLAAISSSVDKSPNLTALYVNYTSLPTYTSNEPQYTSNDQYPDQLDVADHF